MVRGAVVHHEPPALLSGSGIPKTDVPVAVAAGGHERPIGREGNSPDRTRVAEADGSHPGEGSFGQRVAVAIGAG